MADSWPGFSVTSTRSKKRGGAGLYLGITVKLTTRVPCGTEIEETGRDKVSHKDGIKITESHWDEAYVKAYRKAERNLRPKVLKHLTSHGCDKPKKGKKR